jgi:CheY-like chemotaxis protein
MSRFPDPALDPQRIRRDDARAVVLYVEDHPVNVLIMEALLHHRPHLRLVVATTGEEGLQAARIEQPDLILLDYHLPDCNGVELLTQMRNLEGLRDVPAVAVSATDSAVQLRGSTFCEFWPKPLDVSQTLDAIDRLIDNPPPPRRAAAVDALSG